LFTLPDSLTKAAACARAAGIPDAATRLADLVGRLTSDTLEVPS
jgi:hypothetical protein